MEIQLSGITSFELSDLESYTSNWQTVIATGGYSTVYKGNIPDSNPYGLAAQVVAVKVSIPGRIKMFDNELEHTPKNPQPNVIHIIGYCQENDKCYIVLPFFQRGDLDKNYIRLTWEDVLKVAKGIANGIRYFHTQDNALSDLKPANILLDEDLTPFLCDFGSVAQVGSSFESQAHTPTYMDPIATETGKVEKDEDMYAYGLIILQLIMKQPVYYSSTKISDRALLLYMRRRNQARRHVLADMVMGKSWRKKHVVSDILRGDGCSRKDAKRISKMALGLVLNPADIQATLDIAPPVDSEGRPRRPGIQDVIELLESIRVRRGFLGWVSKRVSRLGF